MAERVLNKPDQPSDADLLARLRRGEAGAFDELVARHQRSVYGLAWRMTGSAPEADDVAQETFVRAWKALPGFRGEASLKTWLLRITANLSLNVVQSARVARREPGDVADRVLAVAPDAERRLLDAERQARLGPAIQALPDRQRATLLLRVDGGMMFREIAEAMGCTIGTAKANFFHAVAALRRAMKDLA
jgi:RNA polymerase sigma-70 factor (ECF subfamily)